MEAVIKFSDNSKLTIHENDCIVPIIPQKVNDKFCASMTESIPVYFHTHNGLIPSLMDAFCNCDYFYLNQNYSIAYCTKSIISIETEL